MHRTVRITGYFGTSPNLHGVFSRLSHLQQASIIKKFSDKIIFADPPPCLTTPEVRSFSLLSRRLAGGAVGERDEPATTSVGPPPQSARHRCRVMGAVMT